MSKSQIPYYPPDPGWVCEFAIDTAKEYRNLKFCKRCGGKIGRYAYKMIHPLHGYLWVDQDCAHKLGGRFGHIHSRLRQRQLERYYSEKEKRMQIFLSQRWRPTKYGGQKTYYYGRQILVFPANGAKWAVHCHGKAYYDLEGRIFLTEVEAKDAAFYIYEGLPHEPYEFHAAYEYRLLRPER